MVTLSGKVIQLLLGVTLATTKARKVQVIAVATSHVEQMNAGRMIIITGQCPDQRETHLHDNTT